MKDKVMELMKVFYGSFINHNFELILIPKTNLYFRLEDIKNEEDLICKLLEWCSRDCYKRQFYKTEKRNEQYHNEVLDKLNIFLKTNFNQEDMDVIYTKLGNSVNHKLTQEFVRSGFDMSLLER